MHERQRLQEPGVGRKEDQKMMGTEKRAIKEKKGSGEIFCWSTRDKGDENRTSGFTCDYIHVYFCPFWGKHGDLCSPGVKCSSYLAPQSTKDKGSISKGTKTDGEIAFFFLLK